MIITKTGNGTPSAASRGVSFGWITSTQSKSKSKSIKFDCDFDCDFDLQQSAGNYTLKGSQPPSDKAEGLGFKRIELIAHSLL